MKIIEANIVTLPVDVIVNSAHPTLMAGSGVSGAIHGSAGPELEGVAKPLGPLEPGQAATTEAFKLPAKYIIHAVAPRYLHGTDEEEETLASTYRAIVAEFNQLADVRSISLPSIGTGIYRWPLELAANIAMRELSSLHQADVVFCVFGNEIKSAYQAALDTHQRNE